MISIVGTGPTARDLAVALAARGERPQRVRRALAVRADAGAVFVVTGSDRANLAAVRALRAGRPDLLVLAESGGPGASRRAVAAGADFVLEPGALVASTFLSEITELERRRLARRLVAAIRPAGRRGVAVFLHDNPDPDTISSAVALQRICARNQVRCALYYGGEIARPGNRLLVTALDAPLVQLKTADEARAASARHALTALVESSLPGQNNILPPGSRVDLVIDHHPLPGGCSPAAAFADIRPQVGAVATMLSGYLRRLWIRPDPALAAGLLFAVKADTDDLTRHVSGDDLEAAVYLAEHADLALMRSFISPPMPSSTADLLARAIGAREMHGGHLLACAGEMRDRDSLAVAADFLVRLEAVKAAVVFGVLRGDLFVSARSNDPSLHMGRLLRRAFGRAGSAGGHASSAGARVPLEVLGRARTDESRSGLARRAVRKLYLGAAGLRGEG
ncbi:MAG: bifunctional oligoribonuclease/PAP phosphatase NrnA [Euryarchaeota archaeon]|nr:bifunctional oligoribonuclease/PAP phosphatase NrnA [Euryarchaeota archaeon]